MLNSRTEGFPDLLSTSKDSKLIIEAERNSAYEARLKDLWIHRDLILLLALRDIKLRYKQTILGAAWAILQPLLSVGVFSLFFGRLAKIPSEGMPYPLFVFSGLVLWTYFSNALNRTSNSLIGNASLISKVYFPRVLIPISSLLPGMVDFVVALVTLMIMFAVWNQTVSWQFLWMGPMAIIGSALLALGFGFWLSAFNVKYRDVGHVLPFFVQLWMFCTPIVYPLSMIPGEYHAWAALNPMVGYVELFRSGLKGVDVSWGLVGFSSIVTIVLAYTGLYYFTRVGRDFADIV